MSDIQRRITSYVTYEAFAKFWSNMETYVLPKYIDSGDTYIEPGTYYNLHINENGIVTAGSVTFDATKIEGIISMDNLPDTAKEKLVVVEDESTMLALTTNDVQDGDTVKRNDNQIMYYVVDSTKLGTIDAFDMYKVGDTESVEWMSVKNKPESMKSEYSLNVDYADVTKEDVSYNGSSSAEITIPDKLSNPNALSIGLANNTTVTYDGSTETTVGITAEQLTDNWDSYTNIEVDEVMKNIVPVLMSIEVTNRPTKTEYKEGESFDKTGMIITANYSNGNIEEVTEYTVDKTTLVLNDTSVAVSYTYEGVTKTTDVAITVKPGYVVDVTNLKVGDELTITHDVYGDVPFIVIGKNHDGAGTATILSKEILQLLPFDAREPSNSDSNRKNNGNNRYLYSNLLQWMNSEAEAGQWYTAKHSADQSPNSTSVVSYNPYADKAGFLHGFSSDFKRQLVTVNKTTAKNTVTDGGGSETVSSKAFLLSTTEVGLANENNIAEGTIYEYFSQNNTDARRVAYPSTYCLNNAGGYTSTSFAEGKGWQYWLRTPRSGTSYDERYVTTSGTLNHRYACNGHIGVRVGLTIANQ